MLAAYFDFLRMLNSIVTVTLLFLSYALALPSPISNVTNNRDTDRIDKLKADNGDVLKRPPPREPFTFRPPVPFLWRPDPDYDVYINFTSYARPVPWLAGKSLMYVSGCHVEHRNLSE